jgi:adenine-specific DNA-methyltransferase
LFEKETEKYDFLTFPSDLFTNLFEFFEQYNFTIFEDSPEEHTVAVDPEMLGHIFENLLEDNKDKGAFYTPKEIVHYMTQESLIEYLHTQLPDADRTELENFVKNKVSTGSTSLSKEHKAAIDQKLDTVKICDPAIGSGAFPMGLLQEIFGLKERIAYDLGLTWSPATVKENIIQKSIYGVDIERGAVDIARLRFWLSLIVDEEMPKALPNLDYKIVVGNSLVSKFDDTVIEIDWERKGSVGEADKHVQRVQTALKSISEKQKQFFESKSNKQKAKLKAEIRDLKLDVLINQLSFNKAAYQNRTPIKGGFAPSSKDIKHNLEREIQIAEFNQTLSKLKRLKDNHDLDFNHFDWKLDFPEVLNPLVNEETGFDIVIGNPPYVRADNPEIAGLREDIINSKQFVTLWEKWDLMVPFYERSLKLLKNKAVHSFIVSNAITTSKYAQLLQQWIMDNYQLRSIDYFENVKVFDAGVIPVITIIKSGSELDHSFKIVRKNDFKSLTKQQVNYDSPNLRENLFKKVYSDSFSIKVPFSFLGDICYLSKGMVTNSDEKEAQGDFAKNDLISDIKDLNHPKEYIEGKNIKFYLIEKIRYIEYGNGRVPDQLSRPTFKDLYNGQKILRGRVTPGVIDRTGIVCNDSIVIIKRFIDLQGINERSISASLAKNNLSDIQKNLKGNEKKKVVLDTRRNLEKLSEQFSLEYLLGVINSKYAFAYLNNFRRHRLENYFYPDDFRNFPIPNAKIKCQKIFDTIVVFLHLIKKTPLVIIDLNPNTHLSDAFQEVIDALVFELYFPEEFAEKGIEIEKYAKDIFKPVDDLPEEEQIKVIQEAYQTFREKDNPLRNQIKLMKIELKELLLPILSV